MDLHGMKRKDLKTLCKKHGIPRNLKNSEMYRRLVLVFEEKETAMENKLPAEDSVEAACGINEKNVIVVSGETKKVSFSPETEVFEFTRSLKKCKRNKVQKQHQQGGIVQKGTRRSERIGCRLAGVMGVKRFVDEDISKRLSKNESVVKEITNQDGFKLEEVRRRSTRLAKSCVGGEISKAELFSCAKRSKQLVDTKDREHELVNVKDDPQVNKVPRRSKRFLNATTDVETNTQAQRRSTRLKARAAKPSMGGDYQKY